MSVNNIIKTSKKEAKDTRIRAEVAVSITSTQAKQLQNVMALACLWRLSLDMTAIKSVNKYFNIEPLAAASDNKCSTKF
jgi:hypothetical protein